MERHHRRRPQSNVPLWIALAMSGVTLGVFLKNDQVMPVTLTGTAPITDFTPDPTPTETQLPQTPTQTPTLIRLPDQNHEDSMNATATQISREGRLDTFEPALGFTREDFEAVQRSTFLIDGLVESGYNLQATAWVIGRDESVYYLATAGHVGTYFTDTNAVLEMSRPGIDTDKYRAKTVDVLQNPESDIAILKVEVTEDMKVPANPIPYAYNFEPQRRPVMIVGYPAILPIDVTSGTATEMYVTAWPDMIFAYASTSGGASGSPIVVKQENGDIVAVAVVSYEYQSDSKVDGNTIQKRNAILGTLIQFPTFN